MAIEDRLKRAILRVLKLDDWDIEAETLAHEVPGWDSLSHIQVIAEVEREYGVRFKSAEVVRLANIGELQQLVEHKTADKG